jgi:hypothetical protein
MELLRPAGAVFRWRDSRRAVRLAFFTEKKRRKGKEETPSRESRVSRRQLASAAIPPRGGFPSGDHWVIK